MQLGKEVKKIKFPLLFFAVLMSVVKVCQVPKAKAGLCSGVVEKEGAQLLKSLVKLVSLSFGMNTEENVL